MIEGDATDESQPADGLNEPQLAAVLHAGGPLLVLAGAGSGKTRVLTRRIARLVATGEARPDEILAITFTNKAASEMRERVEREVGPRARAMWLTTFHSACARILRVEAERLGYTRNFTIYDQADAGRLVRRCQEELKLDPKRFPQRMIQHRISDVKNRLIGAGEFAERVDGLVDEVVAEVYRVYERRLHSMNAMDFDDLLFRSVELFETFPEARDRYRRAFRHILVDEYQDTNAAQYRWLTLLAEEHRNLCVVGDDDQAIYGFRGADIRNILDFEKDFGDATTVRLEQNYRSTQTILEAANAVIAHNRGRKGKELWSAGATGVPVRVRELENEHAEARFVVSEIERLTADGVSRDQIAVFYRTNAQARVLEDALVRYQVGYQVIGGVKFYERAEIKDVIAYLALLVNPHDVVSFQRIVNVPRRGLGQTSVGRVIAHANTTGASVMEVAENAATVPGLGAAAIKALGRFTTLIGELRAAVAAGRSLGDLVEAVIDDSGMAAALKAEQTIEAEGRLENLAEFVGLAREAEAAVAVGLAIATITAAAAGSSTAESAVAGPTATDAAGSPVLGDTTSSAERLAEFLQQIALLSDQDGLRDDAEAEGLVTLMTLHNAKGLEFPVVFIIGCEDGVFPHSRALDSGDVEEERRLCYVGMTRARESLYITYARTRSLFGTPKWNLRSRFIDELPARLCDFGAVAGGFAAGFSSGAVGAGSSGPSAAGRGSGSFGSISTPESGAFTASDPDAAPRSVFRLGDDVMHASFGEGVVIGLDGGGMVTVRFPSDRSERRLMIDYAPLTLLTPRAEAV